MLPTATLDAARALLGWHLIHDHPAGRMVGRIVETEGYTQDDPAFAGWGPRDAATGLLLPEGRGLPLFGLPGHAFFYRAYTHWLFHVITEAEGYAGCVFVRAAEPLAGLARMQAHRPAAHRDRDLANGPGKLTQAFDLGPALQGHDLTRPPLTLHRPADLPPFRMGVSTRIGLNRGIELRRRFFIEGNPYVSPATPSDIVHQQKRPRTRLGRR